MISSLLSLALAASPGADAVVGQLRGFVPTAVTVSYEAEVVGWDGSLPEVWELGQRINVSYTLDPGAVFEQTAPDSGYYLQGVVSTRIEVPSLGLVVDGGSGTAHVIDDRASGDMLFDNVWFRSDTVSDSPVLGGELVTASGVDLVDWGPGPGLPSQMVENFALPMAPVIGVSTLWAFLVTAENNYGFVQLQPIGGPALVTLDYQATVISANGSQGGEFPVGQPLLVSYTLDPSTQDSSSNPDLGLYRNGLRSLTVVMPELGEVWYGGVGDVYAFNDVETNDPLAPLSDQVFFMSETASGTLGGLPIEGLEVDFIERVSEGLPGMLDSTAMPTDPLEANDTYVMFSTAVGLTFVRFEIDTDGPGDRMPELIAAARDAITWLIASPNTARSVTRTLERLVDPIETAHAAADVGQMCFEVGRAVSQLDLLVRIRRVAAADTTDLRGVLAEMELELGCNGG